MKRSRAASLIIALLVMVGLVGACRVGGKPEPYLAIGTNGEALRAAFNADLGKARLLLLVAPT